MARVYITNGVVYLSKQVSVPATPAADELGIFLDSSEILSFILDTGVTRNLPAWVPLVSFTPAITFGGGNTGITYTTQFGRVERTGGLVVVSGQILLSNKGSSTGAVRVTGLPIASDGTANFLHPVVVRLDTMSSISGSIQGLLTTNSTEFRIEHLGTGTAAELTNAHFNNTSQIVFKIIYH